MHKDIKSEKNTEDEGEAEKRVDVKSKKTGLQPGSFDPTTMAAAELLH